MQELLSRYSFDATKIDIRIWAVILFVWLVVAGCGVGSVYAQGARFSYREKWLWILLILGVPIAGLLAYLPFSYRREGFTLLRQPKDGKKRLASKKLSQDLLKG